MKPSQNTASHNIKTTTCLYFKRISVIGHRSIIFPVGPCILWPSYLPTTDFGGKSLQEKMPEFMLNLCPCLLKLVSMRCYLFLCKCLFLFDKYPRSRRPFSRWSRNIKRMGFASESSDVQFCFSSARELLTVFGLLKINPHLQQHHLHSCRL